MLADQRRERPEALTRADLAYEIAGALASRGLDDATVVYEIALEYDPDHAMAANDLGYTLLERDVRREDAARVAPEEAHVAARALELIDFMDLVPFTNAMAGGLPFPIRKRVELARVPESFKGLPIAFLLAGLFALAFMGFSGLDFTR